MNSPAGETSASGPSIADVPAPSTDGGLDLENLVTGARWVGTYQVGDQLPDITYGKVFKALHVGTTQDVRIRSFRVVDEVRRRTWDELTKLGTAAKLGLLEYREHDGRRVEVVAAPHGRSLREWYAGKKATLEQVEELLAQIVPLVAEIHGRGIAHLNLTPDSVFAEAVDGRVLYSLGGTEAATQFNLPGQLVAVTVDPFYAPPEAMGIFQHACSPAMRAWDWWMLGRIVQELAIGQHVLGIILDRDVSRRTPELLVRAENLVREKDKSAARAGGVESMPPIDKRLDALLRGLLTSSRDARWGIGDINKWIRKEAVKDRYTLPIGEKLFVWKEQRFTVPEAAEYFARAENWAVGIVNLFEPNNPDTLIAFLAQPGLKNDMREKTEGMLRAADSSALKALPQTVVRELVAAAVWTMLKGHPPVLWRGREINHELLKEWLCSPAGSEGRHLAEACEERTIVQPIENLDTTAGRFLSEFERKTVAALQLAHRMHWLEQTDEDGAAKLALFCLESEKTLREIRGKLRDAFARSREEEANELLRKENPTLAELAVLAFLGQKPEQFKFVTHLQHKQERFDELSRQAVSTAAAIAWLRLAQVLSSGPLVFGKWIWMVGAWLACWALAFVAAPSRWVLLAGLLPGVAAVLARIWFGRAVPRWLAGKLEQPWQYRGAQALCEAEAAKVLKTEATPVLAKLKRALKPLADEAAKLDLHDPAKHFPQPPRFLAGWALVAFSWLMLGASVTIAGRAVLRHPPTVQALRKGFLGDPLEAAAKQKAAQEQAEQEKEKKVVDVKVNWPYRVPLEIGVVTPRNVEEATEADVAAVKPTADRIFEPYERKTINTAVALRVPTINGVKLILWDGSSGRPADRKVYSISYLPMTRSWMILGGKQVMYLSAQ